MPKRDQILSLIDDSDTDVLALTETWLQPEIDTSEIFDTDSYNVYRHDRADKRGGGVLLAIRKTIPSFSIDTNSGLEITWAACFTPPGQILIGVCYRPPDFSNSFVEQLRNSIIAATQRCKFSSTYLLGDFNYPLIDWPNLSSSCRSSLEFVSLTLDFNLFQVISEPTRGSNTLDLLLTSSPENIGNILFINGFSDHKVLQLPISVPSTFNGSTTKKIRDYNKANYLNMNSELNVFFNDTFLPLFSSRSVDENWMLFRNKCQR